MAPRLQPDLPPAWPQWNASGEDHFQTLLERQQWLQRRSEEILYEETSALTTPPLDCLLSYRVGQWPDMGANAGAPV